MKRKENGSGKAQFETIFPRLKQAAQNTTTLFIKHAVAAFDFLWGGRLERCALRHHVCINVPISSRAHTQTPAACMRAPEPSGDGGGRSPPTTARSLLERALPPSAPLSAHVRAPQLTHAYSRTAHTGGEAPRQHIVTIKPVEAARTPTSW